jgi:hypothetical protein
MQVVLVGGVIGDEQAVGGLSMPSGYFRRSARGAIQTVQRYRRSPRGTAYHKHFTTVTGARLGRHVPQTAMSPRPQTPIALARL